MSAVAHKMGRQWIAVEQMDYIKDLPEARLKKVIEGEQGGISKAVDWKGGGDFIYLRNNGMEWTLCARNSPCQRHQSAFGIYNKIKDEPFIRYDVDMSVYETDDFKKLDFEEQQKFCLPA